MVALGSLPISPLVCLLFPSLYGRLFSGFSLNQKCPSNSPCIPLTHTHTHYLHDQHEPALKLTKFQSLCEQ